MVQISKLENCFNSENKETFNIVELNPFHIPIAIFLSFLVDDSCPKIIDK